MLSYTFEYSKLKGNEHDIYIKDDYNARGNMGLGVSVFGREIGYNCSYSAYGETINNFSKVHSFGDKYLQSSSNGKISLGLNAALVFGLNIEIYTEYAK